MLRRRLARGKVLEFFATLPRCLVGMEAGGGAHHWARELTRLGHDVRLMPPQYVRPYVKTNKHDAADAAACCEAVQRRGLGELLVIVGDAEDRRLPPLARELAATLAAQLRELDRRIEELDRRVMQTACADASCARLLEVPGIGPVIATALVATVPDARLFASGRHFAAWLGLVPRQHSSGGKRRLLSLSKRGDGYLRRQLMHGARAVVRIARGREGAPWSWINRLLGRRPFNVVVAAVANKLARTAWALLARGESWRPA